LILLNFIFFPSNDLRGAIFRGIFEGSAQIKKRCSDRKRPRKEKWQKQTGNLDTADLTRANAKNFVNEAVLEKLLSAPLMGSPKIGIRKRLQRIIFAFFWKQRDKDQSRWPQKSTERPVEAFSSTQTGEAGHNRPEKPLQRYLKALGFLCA